MPSIYLARIHPAPKFLMNRKYLLPLALLLFTLIVAACGGGEDFSPPEQPNLSLQAGEQSDAGLRTVACWPKGENNVSCEFTNDADSPSPSTALVVQGGQAVTVAIANPEGVALPNQVVITSRETDATGTPLFTKQIDPAQSTEFELTLPNGRYLLDVTAYYADIEGSSATVSNVFAVDVGQAVAGNVTPPATEAVTPEATEVATEATTPEATVESTEEATAESTEVATVEATPEATEIIPEATEESGTGGGDTTPAATEESIEPTAEPTETVEATEVATEPAVTEEAATATPGATESATPVTPVATTPAATEEVVVPTETATEVVTEPATETPTEEVTEVAAPPTNTATPTPSPTTPVPPTATATPTVTSTLAVSPTNTSVFEVDAPPTVALKVSGRNYQPVGYDYCRRNASNELVCVKQPFSTTGTTTIRVARNAAANIRIEGSRPTSIEINYLSRDTLQPLATETRTGDNVVLFNLGVAAGSYILSVEIAWPDVTVTYYFQLQVLQ